MMPSGSHGRTRLATLARLEVLCLHRRSAGTRTRTPALRRSSATTLTTASGAPLIHPAPAFSSSSSSSPTPAFAAPAAAAAAASASASSIASCYGSSMPRWFATSVPQPPPPPGSPSQPPPPPPPTPTPGTSSAAPPSAPPKPPQPPPKASNPAKSRGPSPKATAKAKASAVSQPSPSFEEYWSEEKVRKGIESGELVKGRLHVPAYQTDTAFVVTTVRMPGHGEDGKEEDVEIMLPITGFIGRNRALNGDLVAAIPIWAPWRGSTSPAAAGKGAAKGSASGKGASKGGKGSSSSSNSSSNSSSSSPSPFTAATAGPEIPPLPPPATKEAAGAAEATATEAAATETETAANVQNSSPDDAVVVKSKMSKAERAKKAIVQKLEDCEERSIPLSVLGQDKEIQKLRGKTPLRKFMSQFSDDVELLEAGEPPEPVARLVSTPGSAEGASVEQAGPAELGLTSEAGSSSALPLPQPSPRTPKSQKDPRKSASVQAKTPPPTVVAQADAAPRSVGEAFTSEDPSPEPTTTTTRTSSSSITTTTVPPSIPPPPPPSPMDRAVVATATSTGAPAALGVLRAPSSSSPSETAGAAGAGTTDREDPQKGTFISEEMHQMTLREQEAKKWDKARCRVVSVIERPSAEKEIVALLQKPTEDGLLKIQPRDTRLPAFWVKQPSEKQTGKAESPITQRRRGSAVQSALEASGSLLSQDGLLNQLNELEEGSPGLLCVGRFLEWPKVSLSPQAEVVAVLGPSGSVAAESDALLSFYGLDWRPFPKEVEEDLKERFPDTATVVREELKAGRPDLRHVRCITIDPATAKDLDDAVSLAPGKAPGTFRVGVHVADVAHFVRAGDPIDQEARARATTVYLIGRVYPMLPRWLSENLCSLLPDGDRLAVSVFFTLDEEGQLVDAEPPEIQRGVIRTLCRLSYNEVDEALEGTCSQNVTPDILSDIKDLAALSRARKQWRLDNGAVVLERSHFVFQTDDNGAIEAVHKESASSISHSLIEELMVLANHVVAARLVEAGEQAAIDQKITAEAGLSQPILRRHPDTEGKVRKRIFELLPPHLHDQAPKDAPLPALLAWCKQHWSSQTHEAVCADVLTDFKEAEYVVVDEDEEEIMSRRAEEEASSQQQLSHWALAMPTYMHFTSPIRRYADILVHRRINHIIGADREAASDNKSYSQFLEWVKHAVDICNSKKRDAKDASTDAIQVALSNFLHRSGGMEIDDAVVTRILIPRTSLALPESLRHPVDEESVASSGSDQNRSIPDGVAKESFQERLKKKTMKEAMEIFVPMAQCARSVSFDMLNVEPVPGSALVDHPGGNGNPQASLRARSILVRPKTPAVVTNDGENEDNDEEDNDDDEEGRTGSFGSSNNNSSSSTAAASTNTNITNSTATTLANETTNNNNNSSNNTDSLGLPQHHVEIKALEPIAVRLVSEDSGASGNGSSSTRHWTVRLPWAPARAPRSIKAVTASPACE